MRPLEQIYSALPKGTALGQLMDASTRAKACVRAQVEHALHGVKNLFKHQKVRYRGLQKNGKQTFTLLGLANSVLVRWWLVGGDGLGVSAVR